MSPERTAPVAASRRRQHIRPPIVRALWRGLYAGSAVLLLTNAVSHAENLDAGKSGQRLFAESCSACHRNPRGLAKGRFKLTLYLFLQQHYTTGSDSASALASYLQSVDTPERQSARGTKSSRPPRPPRPIQGH